MNWSYARCGIGLEYTTYVTKVLISELFQEYPRAVYLALCCFSFIAALSSSSLFADDAKIVKSFDDDTDSMQLENDVDALNGWSEQ